MTSKLLGQAIATGTLSGNSTDVVVSSNGSIELAANNGTDIFIAANNNVGIGTSTPNYKLSVADSSAATRTQVINNANNTSGVYLMTTNTAGGVTSDCTVSASANNLYFFTAGGNERMRIDSAGNIGINGASAGAKLDVNGATRLGQDASLNHQIYGNLDGRFNANWNYSNFNLIRTATNAAQCRNVSFMLDGDAGDSTTVGGYPSIWSFYSGTPTTGSTSSALNAEMGFGAYTGFRWYVNGSQRLTANSSSFNVGYNNGGASISVCANTSLPTAVNRQITIGSVGGTSSELTMCQIDAKANARVWNLLVDGGNSTTNTNFTIRKLDDTGTGIGGTGFTINGTTGIFSTNTSRSISPQSVPAGSIIQVVWNGMSGTYSGSGASLRDTGLGASFTPLYSTSRILHIVTTGAVFTCDGQLCIARNGTVVSPSLQDSYRDVSSNYIYDLPVYAITWIDSPATTSAITYRLWACATGCGQSIFVGNTDGTGSWLMMEIAG